MLATLNPDGSPLAMPMWFLADAEAITMLSVDGLAKVRNLKADPRVCVVAEGAGERGNIRGVAVQGAPSSSPTSPRAAPRGALPRALRPRIWPASGRGGPCRRTV